MCRDVSGCVAMCGNVSVSHKCPVRFWLSGFRLTFAREFGFSWMLQIEGNVSQAEVKSSRLRGP
jgi:hypothetical protein